MQSSTNDPLDFISNNSQVWPVAAGPAELIQLLLYEIMRVKEIIKYYQDVPNGAGNLGASILQELVSEAYNSLVNYDTILMRKYVELLQHCD